MNELKKKFWDYRCALEAEKHLPEAANEVQADNNVRVRSEAAEAKQPRRGGSCGTRFAALWRQSMILMRLQICLPSFRH